MNDEFESWRSYWVYSRTVRTECRYLHSNAIIKFLTTVLETGRKRATIIPKGTILWRSQLGTSYIPIDGSAFLEERPLAASRMVPRQYMAKEGRVNPKGIPCLYLASDMDTALSEARPWMGSSLSLGEFKVLRSLKVIDFSKDDSKGRMLYKGREPSPEVRERNVWQHINHAFSNPVSPNDEEADYVPTQILAEAFKTNGYEGLVYKSSCGMGHNIALFDINSVKFVACRVCTATSLHFEFDKAGHRYIE